MADPHEEDRDRYLRDRHAAFRHPKRKRPDGDVHRGPGPPDPVLRRGIRTEKYQRPPTAGHRRGKRTGRQVRQTRGRTTRRFPQDRTRLADETDQSSGGPRQEPYEQIHILPENP